TIWLDVHPYLSGKIDKAAHKVDWQAWNDNVAAIRAAHITNPLVATEWGAKSANTWLAAHPKGNYMKTFDARVVSQDPYWAGLTWYEMLYDKSTPNAGLFDATGNMTALGAQYVGSYKH